MTEVASDTRLCELGRQLEELWQKEQIEEAAKEGNFSIEEEDRLLDEVISPEATIIQRLCELGRQLEELWQKEQIEEAAKSCPKRLLS